MSDDNDSKIQDGASVIPQHQITRKRVEEGSPLDEAPEGNFMRYSATSVSAAWPFTLGVPGVAGPIGVQGQPGPVGPPGASGESDLITRKTDDR